MATIAEMTLPDTVRLAVQPASVGLHAVCEPGAALTVTGRHRTPTKTVWVVTPENALTTYWLQPDHVTWDTA